MGSKRWRRNVGKMGIGTLEIERSRAQSAQEELESLLVAERTRLESVRRQVSDGLRDFRAQFEKQLAIYKSQRAWRAMLAIRKAYTLPRSAEDPRSPAVIRAAGLRAGAFPMSSITCLRSLDALRRRRLRFVKCRSQVRCCHTAYLRF